jgi:methylthioribose-1-phosphate isomerase
MIDPIPTMRWMGSSLRLLDQRELPEREEYLDCADVPALAEAIRTLAVRGAPAIGLAAAYGAVIAALTTPEGEGFREGFSRKLDTLAATRPTAVNLFGCLRVQREVAGDSRGGPDLVERLRNSADRLFEEDLEASRKMGRAGADLLPSRCRILTHCNAGGLATAGLGTALAVVYEAADRGIVEMVYADETRPLLQGARLTAWELCHAGVPVTVQPDSAAAALLREGGVDAVITGADRIAANGDVANKIGTYPLALAAREAGVPFYVAAPTTTLDPETPDGDGIEIEQRSPSELERLGERRIAPREASFYNPAFDVTPWRLVRAIVTERGLLKGGEEGLVSVDSGAV